MKELNTTFSQQTRKAADVDQEMGELEIALRNAQNEAAEAKYEIEVLKSQVKPQLTLNPSARDSVDSLQSIDKSAHLSFLDHE